MKKKFPYKIILLLKHLQTNKILHIQNSVTSRESNQTFK